MKEWKSEQQFFQLCPFIHYLYCHPSTPSFQLLLLMLFDLQAGQGNHSGREELVVVHNYDTISVHVSATVKVKTFQEKMTASKHYTPFTIQLPPHLLKSKELF